MEEARETIESIVVDLTGEATIDHATNLFDAGLLTSVDSAEMLEAIESRLQLSVPDEELTVENFGTIDAMAKLVDRLRGAAS